MVTVGSEVHASGGALAVGGDLLLDALGVMPDQAGCRRQHLRGAAVVCLQAHDLGAGVDLAEAPQVGDGSAAEFVDRLVVVAHYCDVAVSTRQQLHQAQLREVGVLELVHHQVADPLPPALEHLLVALEQAHGPVDGVVEVEHPGLHELFLVGGVDGPDLDVDVAAEAMLADHVAGDSVIVLGSGHLLLGPLQQLEQVGDDVPRPGQAIELLRPRRLENAHHALPFLDLRRDPEGPRDGQPVALLLEEAQREGVEGADEELLVAGLAKAGDPLLHLSRGLLGEREDEDVLGVDPIEAEQVEVAVGDHPGLSGAWPGEHHQLPTEALAGFGLGGVQFGRRLDAHRRRRLPSLRSLSPASRKRMSATAVSPSFSLRLSRMVWRWRWSW